ncbi:MAG: GNAT family N-acetyltransferase [Anaerolineae bacterium]|nr:GNAT family N-acetyltransferase [Anaerolineae bacterium]
MSETLFKGKLVRLAPPTRDDAEAFARWSQDADYLRNLDTEYARPYSAESFIERFNPGHESPNSVTFYLRTLADDKLIGFAAIHSIEWNNQAGLLAIGIGEADYRGRGYGADALRLLLRYAFDELNLYRLGLDVIANNTQAIRAYERVGFKQEGIQRDAVLRDGRRYGRIIMGILRHEWQASR